MSLTICIATPEGIVLAADSRQTYQNAVGSVRVGSDSATKVFAVKERIGVTVAGPAFLPDPDNPNRLRGIGSFINEFINETKKEETVQSVAENLRKYLEDIYKPAEALKKVEEQMEKQIAQLGGKIIKRHKLDDRIIMDITDEKGKPQKAAGGVMPIALIVAGYDLIRVGKPELNVYTAYIPGPTTHARKNADESQYGATWTGQTDVIQRIIKGRDPRIAQINFLQEAIQKHGEEKVMQELNTLEYIINFGAMTLHDAVDLAKLMIETTSAIQRFSDGVVLAPGDVPGVGGPVDIAVILPKEGFHWRKRKDLDLVKATT